MAKFKRQKTSKRRMAMYHHNFGFREPYQVLLDGNFVHASLQGKLDTRTQLPRILAGRTKPMTTQCVLAEIRALGADFSGTALAVKKLEKRRCPHTNKPVDAATCISGIIGETNQHRYVVATQDAALRKRLREVPGTPLVLISKNVVILEAPSKATELKVKELEETKSAPAEFEKRVLKAEGLDIEPVKAESAPKKKRKRKEPNPLSVKKSKPKPGEAANVVPAKKDTKVNSGSLGVELEEEEDETLLQGDESVETFEASGPADSGESKAKKKRPRKRKRGKKSSAVDGERTEKAEGSGSDSD